MARRRVIQESEGAWARSCNRRDFKDRFFHFNLAQDSLHYSYCFVDSLESLLLSSLCLRLMFCINTPGSLIIPKAKTRNDFSICFCSELSLLEASKSWDSLLPCQGSLWTWLFSDRALKDVLSAFSQNLILNPWLLQSAKPG